MHLCSDAQKPRSVKTAPAVLTYRTSCINATDSKCRRAIKPKALKLSTLSANSRGDDKSRRSHSSVCRRHLRECKSRTSSPEQTFAFQSRQRFCGAARFSVSPEGLGWRGRGMRRKSGKVHPRFPRATRAPRACSFRIPHLLSESRYEIIRTDLNRKVGIIGMRREDFALVTGSDFRHHLILYEEECLKKR